MSFEDIKERIPKNIEAADKWRSPEETWEQKEVLSPCGHAGMEAQCLKKAMETILWVAVREHDSWASAQSVFDKYDVEKLLERYADAMVKAFEEVLPKDTKHPWFVNNDIIHSAVLLGRFDLVKRLYGICHVNPDKKQMPSTIVYSELARGLYLLLHAQCFKPAELKPKGVEKTIAPLVHLIEVCANGGDIEQATDQVDSGFKKRNRDKRFEAPFTMGEGGLPVQWDVYKTSILAIHEYSRVTHDKA